MSLSRVEVWTDGACSGNPGPGGWAAILRTGPHQRQLSGGEASTTNNRMEIQAALQALQALQRPCQVVLHTDSNYLLQGATQWLPGWTRRGWRRAGGKAVLNQDLWQQLQPQLNRHQVQWVKVPAHSGHPLNELADQLAVAACARYGGSGRPRG